MRNKVIKALRIASGVIAVGGFIAMLGVIGADDMATVQGTYMSLGELIKRLSVCLMCILGGITGLNIF